MAAISAKTTTTTSILPLPTHYVSTPSETSTRNAYFPIALFTVSLFIKPQVYEREREREKKRERKLVRKRHRYMIPKY